MKILNTNTKNMVYLTVTEIIILNKPPNMTTSNYLDYCRIYYCVNYNEIPKNINELIYKIYYSLNEVYGFNIEETVLLLGDYFQNKEWEGNIDIANLMLNIYKNTDLNIYK